MYQNKGSIEFIQNLKLKVDYINSCENVIYLRKFRKIVPFLISLLNAIKGFRAKAC
jgi:hypothetical protein